MTDQQPQNDLALKQVILLVKDLFRYIRKKWWVIVIGAFLFAMLGLLFSKVTVPQYQAYASFTTESSGSSSALSSAMAMAGSLGLSTGSSGGFTNELLVGMVQSRRVIKRSLLQKAVVDDTLDLLVNHYIKLYGYEDDWEEHDHLAGFKFENTRLEKLIAMEDSLLSIFFDEILNDFMFAEYAPEIAMVTIELTTKSEGFSKYLCKNLIDIAGEYFIENETRQQKDNIKVIQNRTDSVFSELKAAELQLAQWTDSKKRIMKAEGHLDELQYTRNVMILNEIYGASVSSLEMAKFELMQHTPVLILVDDPEFSVSVNDFDWDLCLIVGIFLGIFLSTSSLIVWKFITDAVNS